MSPAPVVAAALTALLSVSAASGVPAASAVPATSATAVAVATPAAGNALFLDFNGGTGARPDLSSSGTARVTASITSAGGGTVVAERHGQGRAARFEPFDPSTPTELAVVVIEPAGDRDPFAPRERSFTFGATFALDARSQGSRVDNGNNLVQRGLAGDGSQYKLQIDSGRLSCRVAGSAGAVHVTASTELRTERWHRARCSRANGSVTLVLVELTPDGPVRRTWSRSGAIGTLAFNKLPPLSVGGKVDSNGELIAASSDQMNGRVDNVFFRRDG